MTTTKALAAVAFLAMFLLGEALATTWHQTEVVDPISGRKIVVREIMSFGSYVYEWDSKYDMVFWPYTAEEWIWFSPHSGYAAFADDFHTLTPEEKERLKEWLKIHRPPSKKPVANEDEILFDPTFHTRKLLWLEKVYEQRNMDKVFWCHFYRLMAYIFEDDRAKSMEYVRKAFSLLLEEMSGEPQGISRIETLYLLGEYSRRLGRIDDARQYFYQARTVRYKDEKGRLRTGDPYFLKMIKNREKLIEKGRSGPSDPRIRMESNGQGDGQLLLR